jgi:hypothetical protein
MNAIIASRVHSKIRNHYIGRLKLKIIDEVQYLNLDVDFIAKNEYGKKEKENLHLNYKILLILPKNSR